MNKIITDFTQWLPTVPQVFINVIVTIAVSLIILKIILFIVQLIGEWVPFT